MMKMLAFYVVSFAAFLGSLIATMQATEELGRLLSALIAAVVAWAVMIGIGIMTKAIERRFGVTIIERPRSF